MDLKSAPVGLINRPGPYKIGRRQHLISVVSQFVSVPFKSIETFFLEKETVDCFYANPYGTPEQLVPWGRGRDVTTIIPAHLAAIGRDVTKLSPRDCDT